MPRMAYAISSEGRSSCTAGIRNSDSDPRNHRITTTLDTADSTTDPRMPAVHRPITSSITNSTAEIGALNAAASPAAAPTGAISRMRSRDNRICRPSTDARHAPICSDGSSGPSECPDPIASAAVMNFPIAVRNGMCPL